MKNRFLIFLTICILLFVFFFFSNYYFDVFIYDTIYNINYFYLVLVFLLVGSIFYFVKYKRENNN
ncbi:hypothetical protein D0809_12500 [Flavobacterium circumlabens]|uniref:Uncharacterized protein n=1 Tax=Flavobacterium circumlabens TaxID=2133765 RepID=A0A4Y7UB84_9FLAO|nr:hypothetical protein EV142_10446 [Flavobacterium circumlabens]TEB43713.1 hypothetical protein D0809_12500 [Flavobacterium circumlabens]